MAGEGGAHSPARAGDESDEIRSKPPAGDDKESTVPAHTSHPFSPCSCKCAGMALFVVAVLVAVDILVKVDPDAGASAIDFASNHWCVMLHDRTIIVRSLC